MSVEQKGGNELYQYDPIIKDILDIHRKQAENIIKASGSYLVKEAFASTWKNFGHGTISASISKNKINFHPEEIKEIVRKWISDFEICLDVENNNFQRVEDPSFSERIRNININVDINNIISEYKILLSKIDLVESDFANAARAYRSPLKQALNDIKLLYNSIKEIKGPFSDFKNVSVYIHGIESDGEDFFESAKKAAQDGDVIVYKRRDGKYEYYLVEVGKDGKDVIPINMDEIYKHTKERLHFIYETENKNEHRQKTSDDLAHQLIEMGLLNDETKIDMFGHSYGGRRSFQFAMDYPEHVRSITTIGTPYDKNVPGKFANMASKVNSNITKNFGFNPTEFSDYLDFNPKNSRVDYGDKGEVKHSNVYTDMASEAMLEDLEHLKVANPEVYQMIEEMEITAIAGLDYTIQPSGLLGTTKKYSSHDGAVSAKSQRAESLGNLVDHRLTIDVDGFGFIDPAHIKQIRDEDFVELIEEINTYMEK